MPSVAPPPIPRPRDRVRTILRLRTGVAAVLAVAAIVALAAGRVAFGVIFVAAAVTNLGLVVALRRRVGPAR